MTKKTPTEGATRQARKPTRPRPGSVRNAKRAARDECLERYKRMFKAEWDDTAKQHFSGRREPAGPWLGIPAELWNKWVDLTVDLARELRQVHGSLIPPLRPGRSMAAVSTARWERSIVAATMRQMGFPDPDCHPELVYEHRRSLQVTEPDLLNILLRDFGRSRFRPNGMNDTELAVVAILCGHFPEVGDEDLASIVIEKVATAIRLRRNRLRKLARKELAPEEWALNKPKNG